MSAVVQADRRPAEPSFAEEAWTRQTSLLLLAVLVLSTIIILRGIRHGEFSYNVDETQHAMTGFFAADFMRDHPLRHPVDYAYQYYAQYPALSGIIHWPPLFYFFEGLSFLVLGPTVVSARLTILVFALLGLSTWFILLRTVCSEWVAAAGALLLACAPGLLLFEKSVMLEIPCLALCMLATLFWARYLLRESPADVYMFGIFASAAALTKQNSVYLIPFCVLSGLSVRGWRLFFRAPVLKAVAIGVVLTAPFYALVYLVHWKNVSTDLGEKSGSVFEAVAFYWRALPEQLGWSVILLAIVGVITAGRWARPKVPLIMLSWIVACYITFTVIGHKAPRYAIYWIPPFLYFALGPLIHYFRKPALRTAGAVAAVFLAGTGVIYGWSYHRPYVSGYEPVVQRVTQMSRSGVILYDAPLPGNFIFFLRAGDSGRHFVVLRKALYTTQINPTGGAPVELIRSPQQIEELIHAYGIRFFVVSEGTPLKFNSQAILRDLLKGPNYRKIGTFPIESSEFSPRLDLALYENTAWAPPAEKFLRIKMLTLNHDIVVPMDRFNLEVPAAAAGGGDNKAKVQAQ
jgi:hypothetical protein